MSWLQIDDEFEDNAKVAPLSDAAHRVWFLAGCWCKKRKNAHTNGFVPAALLPDITRNRYKPTQLKKLVSELVSSNVGGTKEHGLWESREGGWQFHDWNKFNNSNEPERPEPTPSSQSKAGRASAAKRAELYGTSQPRSPNGVRPNEPERTPNGHRTAFDRTSPNEPEPERRTPTPIPTQDLDLRERDPKDLTGNRRTTARTPAVSHPSEEMSDIKRRLREEPTQNLERKATDSLRDPCGSTFDPPKFWPEVQAMAACFADAYGAPHRRLGDLPRDNGLATLLGILGAGITCQEYFRAVELSLDDEWFGKLKSPGLTTLTLEQVRRMLAEAEERGAT